MFRFYTKWAVGLLAMLGGLCTSYAQAATATTTPCLKAFFEQLGNPSSRDLTLKGPSQIGTTRPHDSTYNTAYLNLSTDGQGAIAYSCRPTNLPSSCNYFTGAKVTNCHIEGQTVLLELTGSQALATLTLTLEQHAISSSVVNIRSQIDGITPSEEENTQFTRLP